MGSSNRGRGRKIDNGDPEAKLLIRREALERVKEPRVLDLYAGEGHMYQQAWKAAAEYLGIDQRFGRPKGDPAGECWKGNNAQLVRPAMRGRAWNLVDLDAWANPWPLLRQVLKLSTADRLVVTATCGIQRSIVAGTSDFAAAVSGASKLSYLGVMTRWYPDIVRWAVAWARSGTGYEVGPARTIQGAHNHKMNYWLLDFSRNPAAKPA